MRIDNARFTGSVDGSQAVASLSGSFTGSGHIQLANTSSYNFASASISASSLILWRGSGNTGQTASLAIISQTSDTASYVSSSNVDGPLGMDSIQTASYAVSASHVEFADSASYALTSSHAVTASYAISASHVEFADSASYALTSSHAITASYAVSASHVEFADSASYSVTSSHAVTASYAVSASHVEFADSASYAVTSSHAVTASYAISASHVEFADSASYAVTASHAITSSYITGSNVYGPFGSNSIISASYGVSSSYAISASHAEFADSASYALTSSHAISASHLIGLVDDAFSADFTAVTTFTATHGLNTNDVIVQVYDTVTGGITRQFVPQTIEVTNVNQVDLTFAVATTGYVVISAGGYLQSGSLQNAQTASYVARVNNTLDQGLGIETFSYDGGTAGVIVQVDTSSAHFLSSSVATSSLAQTASFITGQSYDEAVTSAVAATFNIVHNLNSTFPIVASYNAASQQVIPDTVEIINVNQVDVTFAGAFTGNIVVKK